jgi:pyridinium-3,5-bisthiocarboxylic acid mononucleotide nickel chelatase
MNPEFYDYIMDKFFEAGALDVYFTPIQMKKNRPAVKLSVLFKNDIEDEIVDIIFKETTTLGIRVFDNIKRYTLDREIKTAKTPWGSVRVKIAKRRNMIVNITPEYKDCKKIADDNNIPLKEVYRYILSKIEGLNNLLME